MKNKRLAVLVVVAVMLFAAVPCASAAPPTEGGIAITPFWTNTSKVEVTLNFSGATAACKGTVEGFSGTTYISATFTLQRKEPNGSYTTIKTWTQSASSDILRFSETQSVTSGYTYRLSVSANVTRNGTTESVSNWVENKCG